MPPRFDILALGAVAIDDLIFVEAYPPPDCKVDVRHTERHCGGLAATALVAGARLGARCAYAGVLGIDDASNFAASRMDAEHIDLTHARRDPSARIFHSRIVVGTGGTRNIFSDGRGVVGAAADWPPSEVIQSARVLMVDHVGMEGMLRAASVARDAGIPVVGDLEKDTNPCFEPLCRLTDHLIVSYGFASRLAGCSDPGTAARTLARRYGATAVVTDGARGCWFHTGIEGATPGHIPAFTVDVVDTTGCGDVFHGAYSAALAAGHSLVERLRIAAAAAALKATRPGGQSGAPNRSQLDEFLRLHGGRLAR